VLCPDTRSTDKHGGFQKLSSRNRSHLQRPQIKNYLFEVKEWFFTLAPARRMPQGGEKPAPPSSLTNFKSIGYQDAGACSSSTGPSFRRLTALAGRSLILLWFLSAVMLLKY
jgi:hypothetical protein